MTAEPRLVRRPAFAVVGYKAWIAGQNNSLFGRFWQRCREEGRLARLDAIRGEAPGAQTGGMVLGISRVEADPAHRAFYYMIAVEAPLGSGVAQGSAADELLAEGMECYTVPATQWAAFPCSGPLPDALVEAEMFAFLRWLPTSGYRHALAPEMEVYLPGGEPDAPRCEFWLPLTPSTQV